MTSSLQDGISQEKALKDAFSEQVEETNLARDAMFSAKRDAQEARAERDEAHAKLGVLETKIDDFHAREESRFKLQYQEETGRTYWLFILLICLVPIIFFFFSTLVLDADLFTTHFGIAWLLYEIGAIFVDRYISAKRGYATVLCSRITNTYLSVSQLEWDRADRRADVMALRELIHSNARYAIIKHVRSLNGVCINQDFNGIVTGEPSFLLMSHELLSQLTVPTIMLADDIETVRQRVLASAKTTHTVNIDRNLYKCGFDVVGDTEELALANWMQIRQSRRRPCF